MPFIQANIKKEIEEKRKDDNKNHNDQHHGDIGHYVLLDGL